LREQEFVKGIGGGKSRSPLDEASRASNTRSRTSRAGQARGKRQREDKRAGAFLEAVKATLIQRATTYPPYSEEAQKVADVWTTLHPDRPLRQEDVPVLMRIVKLVRAASGNSPDSLIDEAGYLARQFALRER
jgi:hypothetical protein